MRSPNWVYCVVLVAAFGFIRTTPATDKRGAVVAADSTFYQVAGARVDSATFRGWRVFHSACFGCHGVGAVGTAVAPDLTARVKRLSPVEFAMTVLSRYRVLVSHNEAMPADRDELRKEVEQRQHGPQGQILMPAWESNSQVKPHILDLYAYLRARADGVLDAGRPQRLR